MSQNSDFRCHFFELHNMSQAVNGQSRIGVVRLAQAKFRHVTNIAGEGREEAVNRIAMSSKSKAGVQVHQ